MNRHVWFWQSPYSCFPSRSIWRAQTPHSRQHCVQKCSFVIPTGTSASFRSLFSVKRYFCLLGTLLASALPLHIRFIVWPPRCRWHSSRRDRWSHNMHQYLWLWRAGSLALRSAMPHDACCRRRRVNFNLPLKGQMYLYERGYIIVDDSMNRSILVLGTHKGSRIRWSTGLAISIRS